MLTKTNYTSREQFKKLIALAVPVSIGQAGNIIANMTDTAMLGKYDSSHMIASTFGFQVFIIPFILLIGISIGLSPITAKSLGAGKRPSSFGTALYTYFGFSILVFGLLYLVSFQMYYLHPDIEIVKMAKTYLIIIAVSVIPMSIFFTLKQYYEGYGLTILTTCMSLIANGINIVLNYILIFGNYGFKPMGIDGAATATLVSRVIIIPIFIGFVYFNKKYKSKIKKSDFKFETKKAIELIKIGLPIGFQMFIEVTAFAMAGIFTGWIGNAEQGAHQIALQLAALTYLLATGFGSASTVMAGQFLGEKNKKQLLLLIKNVLLLIIIYEVFTAIIFWIFSSSLPYIFLKENDMEIILIATVLIKFAAVFQVPDGIQNTLQGILRGLQDVEIPTYISLSAHWIITLIGGYILAFHFGFGVEGIWYGFVIGLLISAILLYLRLKAVLKKLNGNVFVD